jgi:hypothetical protein
MGKGCVRKMAVTPSPPNPEPSVLNSTTLQLFLSMRQALLMQVDALERVLGIVPTTAEIRRLYKEGKIGSPVEGKP